MVDTIHPHAILPGPERIPDGTPQIVAKTHRYHVFLLNIDSGEFWGMDAGISDNLALTIEQATAEKDRIDVYFATHVQAHVGPLFGIILDISAGLYWADDIHRFGCYIDHRWLNEEWHAIAERCRVTAGWRPGEGKRIRDELRPKIIAALRAKAAVKAPE